MHGSPLLRTVVILVLLLAAGFPLWQMTHESAAASVIPAAAAPEAQSQVHLAVAFAQKPLRFSISYLGKPVWESDLVTGLTAERDIPMSYPKEGVDLEYNVVWPPGTPLCAARLSVASNDNEPVEKTLWGTGQVDDVLSFP
jgi:hypothetical protein